MPSPDSDLKPPTPTRPISGWVGLAAVLVIAVAIFGSYLWFSAPIPDTPSASVGIESDIGAPASGQASDAELQVSRMEAEARRNALATGAGFAALAALLLAFRRLRHAERQQRYHEYESQRAHEQREHNAEAVQHDAEQRRITDMRVRAVEQLGSDSPTIRIGGLHNLERIGEQHPTTRQVILDEVCSYLRLPYTPAGPAGDQALPRRQFEPVGPPPPTSEVTQSEHEVRLIAQEILQRHLNTQPDRQHEYWEHDRLNLKNAYLDQIDLGHCRLHRADFDGTEFVGMTRFDNAVFDGYTTFAEAKFRGYAYFGGATFNHGASFHNASFSSISVFARATFGDEAFFLEVTFDGIASFTRTNFSGGAVFEDAVFAGDAAFEDSTFGDHAGFDRVAFEGRTVFTAARFGGSASFAGAAFARAAHFPGVVFSGFGSFSGASFNRPVHFEEVVFEEDTYLRTELAALLINQFVRFDPNCKHELPEHLVIEVDPHDPSTAYLAWSEDQAPR